MADGIRIYCYYYYYYYYDTVVVVVVDNRVVEVDS
jgi:hypothetical protein